jgi:hypothetical protein
MLIARIGVCGAYGCGSGHRLHFLRRGIECTYYFLLNAMTDIFADRNLMTSLLLNNTCFQIVMSIHLPSSSMLQRPVLQEFQVNPFSDEP